MTKKRVSLILLVICGFFSNAALANKDKPYEMVIASGDVVWVLNTSSGTLNYCILKGNAIRDCAQKPIAFLGGPSGRVGAYAMELHQGRIWIIDTRSGMINSCVRGSSGGATISCVQGPVKVGAP